MKQKNLISLAKPAKRQSIFVAKLTTQYLRDVICNTCFLVDVKELGIKHPLHRKKLQLALQALGSEEENNKGKLDYNWVTSEYQLPVPDMNQVISAPLVKGNPRPIICVFFFFVLPHSSQDGWMTSVCLSIRHSLMRGGWMVACCTT